MTQFKDTFTQGGQTQLHKLHMIRQVVGSTFKIGLGIFLISFAIFVYWNHCWQDFWYLICFFKAWIRVDYLDILPRGFFDESWIMDSYGVVHTIKDYALLHTKFYQTLKNVRLISLSQGLLYSLLVSIVGYIAVSWFWVEGHKGPNV